MVAWCRSGGYCSSWGIAVDFGEGFAFVGEILGDVFGIGGRDVWYCGKALGVIFFFESDDTR